MQTVTREQFGDRWPFSVDAVTVGCLSDYAVYYEVDYERFALNGKAEQRGFGDGRKLQRVDEAAKARFVDAVREWVARYGRKTAGFIELSCPSTVGAGDGEQVPIEVDNEPIPKVDCPKGYRLGSLRAVRSELLAIGLAACP